MGIFSQSEYSSDIVQHGASELNLRNLFAACSAIAVFGLAFGMSFPLLSLILESRGVSPMMIGINSAMMPLGILVFSSLIPVFSKRFGPQKVAICSAFLTSILFLCYKIFNTLEAWFVIRFLLGMVEATLFVLSESWIVRYSGDLHRGKVVAIYGSVLSASFGAGAALISWIGIEGWLPFVSASIVIILGTIPLFWFQEEPLQTEDEETKTGGLISFSFKAPMLLICVLVFAIFDAATMSLFPVYGLQLGLSTSTAALTLTALIIGNTVLQLPLGWLADKYPHRLLMICCSFTTTMTLLALPLVMATNWMWPLLVAAGTSGYGIYTISLISLGRRFSGIELINGSACFAVMWGAGALIGSISGGLSMEKLGTHGLPLHLSAIYALLVIGLIARGFYLRKSTNHIARNEA